MIRKSLSPLEAVGFDEQQERRQQERELAERPHEFDVH